MNQRTLEDFLSEAERQRVKEAIRQAEGRTSGEIRVHLDDAIEDDVLDHAAFVFEELGMHRTKDRNGVLIYVSVPSQRVAVIGDTAIHAKLGDGYWNEVLGILLADFREGRPCDGLCKGVERLGEQLREHFPHQRDDRNELDDDISYGKR
ncbi:MAG TPA: TPM domain-containing protein [Flavobacteriales bacterium]|nr:TPM domain-containing protein [Flavobacteriales bacterium]